MRPTIFGVPTAYEADRADRLILAIDECWTHQFGSPPGDLATDLEELHAWFDPRATGARLRSLLDSVPPAPETAIPPGFDPLFLEAGSAGHLVTPEGRVVLELLRRTPPDGDLVLLAADDVAEGVELLAETYRRWTTDRLRRVVALLEGETETLRPGAAGLLLVLLVNRNTSEDRALKRPVGDDERAREVEDAVAAPATAWSRTFSSRSTLARPFRLYQGWELGELRRRLGSALVATREFIYVDERSADLALERVTSDLARRPVRFRSKVPDAMSALLREYDRSRPLLRGLGLGFDVPSVTAQIEARVLESATAGEAG